MLVGLIPAAGHGTRLGLADGSKELVEVHGRPVMDLLVERMRVAAPDELRVITRPEKRDLVAHAEALGARVVAGHPPDVARSLLLGVDGLADDDVVMWGFPDSIWQPGDGFAQLLAVLRAEGPDVVLGLFRGDEPERADVVTVDADGWVTGVHVKPDDPPGDRIWGIAVARVGALAGLAEVAEPGHLVDRLSRERRVAARFLSERWTDIGTPEALAAARAGSGS